MAVLELLAVGTIVAVAAVFAGRRAWRAVKTLRAAGREAPRGCAGTCEGCDVQPPEKRTRSRE